MVIIPASVAVPEGLTFTVGQITWTTRGGGPTVTVSEETQIRSGMTAATASAHADTGTEHPTTASAL